MEDHVLYSKRSINPATLNIVVGMAPAQKEIGATSTRVVESNTERVCLTIFNVSNKEMWLAWDQDAELEKGICLPKREEIAFLSTCISLGSLDVIMNIDDAPGLVAFQEFNR